MFLTTIDHFSTENLLIASPDLERVSEIYSLAMTREMLDKKSDAVNRQFVPTVDELITQDDEREDPIGDEVHSPIKGLVHRYKNRILIKITTLCPVYCRFCFRREQVGDTENAILTPQQLKAIYDYIKSHTEIYEVILTGGDPLILSPRRLGAVIKALNEMPHVKIIRIHTRVPIVQPSLINKAMLKALSSSKTLYIGLHSNHKDEWGEAQKQAVKSIYMAGIPLLSQTVLLKGINDTVEALSDLFETFIENRVSPYYLHQLDKAKGTSHFRVTISEGQVIMRQLKGKLSGHALPTYTLDIAGGFGKVSLTPSYFNEETQKITDSLGNTHHV